MPTDEGFELPLTKPVLASCDVVVSKQNTEIWFGVRGLLNESEIRAGLEARCEELERLSPQPLDYIADGLIWCDTGGIANDVDWEQRALAIADATAGIRSAMTDLVALAERPIRERAHLDEYLSGTDPAEFLSATWDCLNGTGSD